MRGAVTKKMKDKEVRPAGAAHQLEKGADELGVPFEEHVDNLIAGLKTVRGDLGRDHARRQDH